MPSEIRQVIENSHLFAGLAPGLMDEIAASATKKTLGAHEVLFQKGDRADALWGVLSGRVVIGVRADDGKEMVLDVFQAGDVFGEVGVLDFGPRRVEATADCKSELFRLERAHFLEHLQTNPELCFRLFSLLCRHLRDTTETLEDTALYKLPSRLAKCLILMTHEATGDDGGAILKVVQSDLARMMGVHRESVNRQLREWEKSGWISIQRERVEILEKTTLAALAAPGQNIDYRSWGNDQLSRLAPTTFPTNNGLETELGLPERRFAGVLAISCVEYAGMLMTDSANTVKRIKAGLAAIDQAIRDHGGRVIWSAGERTLAEFPNGSSAIDAALEIQINAGEAGPDAGHTDSIFRIGIHSGEVLTSDGRTIGDPVNIAIRLTELSGSDGICFTGEVRDELEEGGSLELQYLGKHELKNITNPVSVFSARPIPWLKKAALWADALVLRRYRPAALAAALIVLMGGVWYLGDRMGAQGVPFSDSRLSIAVLPFVNPSADEVGMQFSDGMHAEVLTKLAKLAAVKVISRNSVLGYRGTSKDLRTIGEELRVSTIMEGSVQRMDDRLRVNIQLIDVSTDEHLWVETFDRELSASNMFAIQSEIASAVAQAFGIELSVDEQQRISIRPTENTAAYEAYLMGKHLLAKRTLPAMAESAEFFQQAITLDPDYALAYVGLADAFYVLEWWDDKPSEELLAKSRDALDRALELDDSLGEAYASLGAHLESTDLRQSEEAYQRSIELSPNYATAYFWYGSTLRVHGSVQRAGSQLEEAGILLERARELDPLSAPINVQIGNYLEELGHFDEARAQLDKVLTIDPGFGEIYRDLAALVDTAYRRIDEALAHLHKEISMLGTRVLAEPLSGAWIYVNIAHLYLQVGADDKAVFWIDKALDLAPDHIGARITMLELRLLQGEEFEWTSYPKEPLQLHHGMGEYYSLHIRDVERLALYHDLRAGHYTQARERYAQNYPELLQASPLEVKKRNHAAAIDLALVLAGTGEEDRAKQLLADSLRVIESMPRLGRFGFQIADVLIYAIQGEREKALTALREALDDGWQFNARYILEFEPSLFSLHPDPEYQAMVAEVKAELAEQLMRVQKMERRGELALPPWMVPES